MISLSSSRNYSSFYRQFFLLLSPLIDSDKDFVEYDSDYSKEEESVFEEKIDEEELRLLKREAEPEKVTPPRYRSYMLRRE